MSVVYNTTLKNARLDLVDDAVNQGAGAGKLVIGTGALSGATGVLAEIPLDGPAFGAAVAGVITLAGMPNEANASAGGTAALAELRDSNDVTIVSGLTVGTSGSDITITSTTVVAAQPVRVTAGTITHG